MRNGLIAAVATVVVLFIGAEVYLIHMRTSAPAAASQLPSDELIGADEPRVVAPAQPSYNVPASTSSEGVAVAALSHTDVEHIAILKEVSRVLDAYHRKNGEYPTTLTTLQSAGLLIGLDLSAIDYGKVSGADAYSMCVRLSTGNIECFSSSLSTAEPFIVNPASIQATSSDAWRWVNWDNGSDEFLLIPFLPGWSDNFGANDTQVANLDAQTESGRAVTLARFTMNSYVLSNGFDALQKSIIASYPPTVQIHSTESLTAHGRPAYLWTGTEDVDGVTYGFVSVLINATTYATNVTIFMDNGMSPRFLQALAGMLSSIQYIAKGTH